MKIKAWKSKGPSRWQVFKGYADRPWIVVNLGLYSVWIVW